MLLYKLNSKVFYWIQAKIKELKFYIWGYFKGDVCSYEQCQALNVLAVINTWTQCQSILYKNIIQIELFC